MKEFGFVSGVCINNPPIQINLRPPDKPDFYSSLTLHNLINYVNNICRGRENAALIKIVCLQETCNLLISMARKYLDPSSIFQIEVQFKLIYSNF